MEGRAELGDNKETQPKIVWTRRKKATIASLCMVLFVALASFSIISPFFPNEVRLTSTRSVGFQALKIICVLVASIIRPAGVLKVPERTCIRKWKNNMGRAKRKGTLWHILPILSYWYFRIIGQHQEQNDLQKFTSWRAKIHRSDFALTTAAILLTFEHALTQKLRGWFLAIYLSDS